MADRDDLASLAAVGVLAATLAALAHEAFGHGVACLVAHGEVTLLTAIKFRCLGGGAPTDLAGPLGGLVCGTVAFRSLQAGIARGSPAARLFMLMTGAIALFWFFGQLGAAAFKPKDDFVFAAQGLGWPSYWRLIGLPVAVAGYGGTVALTTAFARPLVADAPAGAGGRRLLAPYLAASLSAIVAGALWRGDRLGSALDDLLSVGVSSLGYVGAARIALRGGGAPPATAGPGIARNWIWLIGVAAAYLAFLLTLGLGVGRLA